MLILTATFLALSTLYILLRERRRTIRAELQRHYLESLLLGSSESERYIDTLTQLSASRSKQVAAELIASLTPIIYKIDQNQLIRLSEALHLSQYMLRRALSSRGVERAQALAILAQIPSRSLTREQIAPFTEDGDRMVRLFALMTLINIDPQNAMLDIARYPSPLTPFELSQLLAMLRQGSIAVAYEPMLASSSDNLNLLGMALVREFGIESAARRLRDIIGRAGSEAVRREALYTLASLHLTLCTPSISSYIGSISHTERNRFLRYAAHEGYSQRVLDFFTTPLERHYFHSLIDSYKVKIGCI